MTMSRRAKVVASSIMAVGLTINAFANAAQGKLAWALFDVALVGVYTHWALMFHGQRP